MRNVNESINAIVVEEHLSDGSEVYSVKVIYQNEYGIERDFEVVTQDYADAHKLLGQLLNATEIK